MLALNKLAAETTQLAVDTLYIHLRVMVPLEAIKQYKLFILSINFFLKIYYVT
jgi:hypothetical protein